MKLKTVRDIKSLKGKTVLLRVAYDVPLKQHGNGWVVADSRRIAETIPTIKYLSQKQCRIVLVSWLGRPGGKAVDKYKMDPVAGALTQLLKKPVKKLDDCIGLKVFREIRNLKNGQLLMLENTRFYRDEEHNGRHFSKLLVHGLDLIVFDAFAQAHRVHASTVGIMKLLPAYAGLLLEREIKALTKVSKNPKRPLVIVLGGAKISDKVGVLTHLMHLADHVLVGGGPANVFVKALGAPIGHSFVQDTFVDHAKRRQVNIVRLARRLYQRYHKKIVLPVDLVSANLIDQKALVELIDLAAGETINGRWKFLDIGPQTIKHYTAILKSAKTIFWNGPMGVFELEKFSHGTKQIAQVIARSKAVTVLGGGDTETVVSNYKLEGKFTHVSTGGGASLEFLAGRPLPALHALLKS